MRGIQLGFVFALAACGLAVSDSIEATDQPLLVSTQPKDSAWILHPAELDESHDGTSNCSPHVGDNPLYFGFGGNRGCSLAVQHEDSACFERETGHDGWIRQQGQSIHCDIVPPCGGGPGDISAIRLCRDPGVGAPGAWPSQASPCGNTGPNGCAACVAPTLVCH
jgi:hypothetical protein